MTEDISGASADVVAFKQPKSEVELAAEHKAAVTQALQRAVAAMEVARKDGFHVEFNCGLDGFGRYAVQVVSIVKRY